MIRRKFSAQTIIHFVSIISPLQPSSRIASIYLIVSKMTFLLQSSFLLCMLLALGVAADRPYNSYYSSGQICTTHSDCSGGQFCGINGYCYCLPNLVYRAASRNCSELACDTNYKSCPETYNCVHNVCTKYCDMESNNCK